MEYLLRACLPLKFTLHSNITCCTQPINAGEHLGAEPVLPYLSPELDGDKLLVGANFASAGVGILNDTGIQFVIILYYTILLL